MDTSEALTTKQSQGPSWEDCGNLRLLRGSRGGRWVWMGVHPTTAIATTPRNDRHITTALVLTSEVLDINKALTSSKMEHTMKLVIIVPDGMCDWRYPELGNRSPAEYANTPGMDKIVQHGCIGLAQTMHAGLPLGSLVGLLGIYGYNPPAYFPLGRSIFEAATLGIEINPGDLVCRCNIVQVSADGKLADFTANQISDQEAIAYLQGLDLPPGVEIYHDLSYRNILVYRDWPLDETKLTLFEPHETVGESLETILPNYLGRPYSPFVEMMRRSERRSQRGNWMLWPWGHGRIRKFPPLPYRSFTVTALSFLYGMAVSLGGKAMIPPGATGYVGSNLDAKFKSIVQHLDDEVDVCLVHCNAPDEEAHLNHIEGKVRAIEDIDRQLVSPLLDMLDNRGEPYRVLLIPDHYTVCQTGRHLPDPIPYAVAGHGIERHHTLHRYSEVDILATQPTMIQSHHLVSTLLA
jgi:2,3-bisphosphoglycerate-independent phosphoglycerate mutase